MWNIKIDQVALYIEVYRYLYSYLYRYRGKKNLKGVYSNKLKVIYLGVQSLFFFLFFGFH